MAKDLEDRLESALVKGFAEDRSRRATTPRDRTVTRQDYRTPQELRHAVESRFGQIVFDLAASDGSEIVPLVGHFTPEQDSLVQPWPRMAVGPCVLWLNPPFKNIDAWAKKCIEWRENAAPGAVICLLVPASVDAVWWRDWVRPYAIAYALAPRVTFAGETQPYPKPCALCVFDPRHPGDGLVRYWRWKP